jgi:hypothetical protein
VYFELKNETGDSVYGNGATSESRQNDSTEHNSKQPDERLRDAVLSQAGPDGSKLQSVVQR